MAAKPRIQDWFKLQLENGTHVAWAHTEDEVKSIVASRAKMDMASPIVVYQKIGTFTPVTQKVKFKFKKVS